MRRCPSWLLLLSMLVVGALACQGVPKDGGPIGDYPQAGGDGPISDFPRGGGGQSEEAEQDPQEPDTRAPIETPDDEQAAPGASAPPFAANADAGPGFAVVDAAASDVDASEADAGEADAGEADAGEADAGVPTP